MGAHGDVGIQMNLERRIGSHGRGGYRSGDFQVYASGESRGKQIRVAGAPLSGRQRQFAVRDSNLSRRAPPFVPGGSEVLQIRGIGLNPAGLGQAAVQTHQAEHDQERGSHAVTPLIYISEAKFQMDSMNILGK
jgi:hypothetical protein